MTRQHLWTQATGRRAARAVALAASLACLAFGSSAQPVDPIRSAVEKAIQGNPEVAARFNAYRAADDAIGVSRGGLLPRLDLDANIGRQRETIKNRTPESQSLSRSGVGLTLSQLLWDGLATFRDVDRLGNDKLARYFELMDTTEQIALEAARAHIDVVRFRRLVELAEDNYVQHKYAALQIQSRTQAGVGRGVDLEQVNARLALAESNLTTEISNLHDVVARYQRLVGDSPPPQLPAPPLLQQGVPNSAAEATNLAVERSPAVSASIESLRAAKATVKIREAAYQPRIEARLRGGGGKNYQGQIDETRATTAEVVMSWNLFAGGSDRARVRQSVNLVNQAADLRDKACRDTRQTAAIAFNDTRKLTEQIGYLDRNTRSIEKARDAYRQQFDTGVGQRSLLDLLNAENEVYTARRALANAQYDQSLAYVRTQASLNTLVSTLGLAKPDTGDKKAQNWTAGDESPARCPTLVPEVTPFKRTELDARADQMIKANPASSGPTIPPMQEATPRTAAPKEVPTRRPGTRSKTYR
jgi:adhesin transport system outer membrane protein